MAIGVVGRKCGMTRVFNDSGISIPVSVVLVEPNRITQIKTLENDGYHAIQVTTGKLKQSKVNRPKSGHFAKAGVEAGHGLWEFAINEAQLENYATGKEYGVEVFTDSQAVDVTGISKGKGFAGVIKRHHFSAQDATHGNSRSHRAAGSCGQNQSPGRVFKGKKMAGRLGNARRTIQNLQIVRVDRDRNLLLIKGAVPGSIGGTVLIKPSCKAKQQGE